MKNSLKIHRLLISFIFLLNLSLAQTDKSGTTSASFLKFGVGARSAAMGFSSVAHSGDISSLYWNPAALGHLSNSDFILYYNQLFEEMKLGFLGISFPSGIGTFGVGAEAFTTGKMTRTEASPGGGYIKLDDFQNYDGAILIGYGVNIYQGICFGFNIKGIYENLAEKSAFAFATDIGLFSKIQMVDVGFVVKNIGTKLKFEGTEFDLPLIIQGGAAAHFLNDQILVSLSGGSVGEGKTELGFGAEYKPIEQIAIRAGYRTSLKDISGSLTGFTAGIGLNLEGVRVDYGYNAFGDLGDVHHISLGIDLQKVQSK